MSTAAGKRGADRVVQALDRAGVRQLFSLSGNQIMPVYDACVDAGIGIVHVRHEAAAVHMADAWGRLTGQPGVALLTAGPGHANGISALYSALACESPMLMLSGHAPLARLGQGAFQEMPQALMAAGVAKSAWTVEEAATLAADVTRALQIAVHGRPGPVHLSLPVDLLEVDVDAPAPSPVAEAPIPGADEETATRLAGMLAAAAHPLVLAGPALARGDARRALDALAREGRVPALSLDAPRGLADPRLGALAEMLPRADLVLLLGRRADFSLRYAEPPTVSNGCRFLQLDADSELLASTAKQLGHRLLGSVNADPLASLPALTRALVAARRGSGEWYEAVADAIAYRPREWRALPADGPDGVHPTAICAAVQAVLDRNRPSVLVTDGGEFGQWAMACVNAQERIMNGPSGAIGGSLPYAAAAALARPGVPVIAMLGDGTAGFHLAEFDTALRAGAPFVAVIGNDARWNAERLIQVREYGAERAIGCDLLPTRYDRVVEALGGHGEHVERADQLAPALERALDSGKPACVNVRLDGQPAPLIRRQVDSESSTGSHG